MKIKKYQQEDKALWNEFVLIHSDLFFFQRDFMEYHQDRFDDHSLMIYGKDHDLIAVLPATAKNSTLNCHGGLTFGFLVGPAQRYSVYNEIWQAIKAYGLENNLTELIYKKPPQFLSRSQDESDVYELLRRGAKTFRSDLTSYIDYSNYTYSKGRKSSVTKSFKQGLTFQYDSTKFQEFHQVLSEVLQQQHQIIPVHSLDEIKLLKSRFPHNVILCTAEKNNQVVAASLLFVFGKVVHTQYLSVTEDGKNLCAMDFLLHSVIEHFKSQGLGLSFGISTEEGGNIINNGLILQKESYGARNHLVYCYKIDWKYSHD